MNNFYETTFLLFPFLTNADQPQIVVPLWLGLLMLGIPTIASVIAMVIAIAKAPFEIMKIGKETKHEDTDYAKNLQDIADRATTESRSLRSELSDVRTELSNLRKDFEGKIAIMQTELNSSREEGRVYRDWSLRLVHQIQSLGSDIQPVPMIPPTLNKG